MKLVGYASIFGKKSEDLGGFREVIEPGAFSETLRSKRNVFALFGHDSNRVLGSTRSGSLKLSEDDQGLRFELDLSRAKTADAQTVHALVSNGDLQSMSFGFRIPNRRGAEAWREEGTELIRHVREVELLEISPVAFPAYADSTVSARSLENMHRELEARERQHRERNRRRKRVRLAEAALKIQTAPPPPPERPEVRQARITAKRRRLSRL